MEKQFVTYEIALKLKELGFDEVCLAVYFRNKFQLVKGFNINNVDLHVANQMDAILAPLWQQCIDWFRDKHHTNIEINRFPNISKWGFVVTDMTIIPKQQTRKENINMSLKVADVRRFDEYFECREQAILKAIELCQNN